MKLLSLRVGRWIVVLCLLAIGSMWAEEGRDTPEPRSVEIRTMFFQCDELSFNEEKVPTVESYEMRPILAGILSASGMLTREQYEQLRKAIKASSDMEMIECSPIFALSGSSAKLAMIQEMRYPLFFELRRRQDGPPVPIKFATEEVGFTMEAQPTIKADGETIALWLKPRFLRLAGYHMVGGPAVYFKNRENLKTWFTAIPAEYPQGDLVQPIFATWENGVAGTVPDGGSLVLTLSQKDHFTSAGRYTFLIVTASIVPTKG